MKIDKFIVELLKKHECVVLPNFGAFIAQEVAAAHVPFEHKFLPPSKQVSFNRLLTNNDGILIQFVSSQLSISYTESQQIIAKQVSEWNEALENNQTVSIKNIGKFFKHIDDKINFLPDVTENLSLRSFGLYPTKHIPIDRTTERNESRNSILSKEVRIKKSSNTKLQDNRKNKNRKRSYAFAAMFCFLIAVACIQLFFFVDAPVKLNEGNFIFFSSPSFKNQTDVKVGAIIHQSSAKLPSTSNQVGLENRKDIELSKPMSNDLLAATETKILPKVVVDRAKGYFIILGCFKERKNATRLYDQLNRAGLQPVMKPTPTGATLVGQFAGTTESEALHELDSKRQQQADVWLKFIP